MAPAASKVSWEGRAALARVVLADLVVVVTPAPRALRESKAPRETKDRQDLVLVAPQAQWE